MLPAESNAREDIQRWRRWALVNLGMSRADFGACTPAEFLGYIEDWKRRERNHRFRFAQVCAVIATAMGAKAPGGAKLTPEYFLGETPVKPKRKRKRSSSNELLQQFLEATAGMKHINKPKI